MQQQRPRYRYHGSRRILLWEVCHQVGRQILEEQVVVVEAEVDRQDRQDHQEDHRRPHSRDHYQDSEQQDRLVYNWYELTRSYWSDQWHFRDT